MPGFHVVVFTLPMPPRGIDGRPKPPGYYYFVSAGSSLFQDYEVYSKVGLKKYPATGAIYHGLVKEVRRGDVMPHSEGGYEVAYYHVSHDGAVDCSVWPPGHAPTQYARFRLLDISSPRDWFRARRYKWVGYYSDIAISSDIRLGGIGRFYTEMRPRPGVPW